MESEVIRGLAQSLALDQQTNGKEPEEEKGSEKGGRARLVD